MAGHPMPSEAYAPTTLDYPTASIGVAPPTVIRNFAQPDEPAVVGYEDSPAPGELLGQAGGFPCPPLRRAFGTLHREPCQTKP